MGYEGSELPRWLVCYRNQSFEFLTGCVAAAIRRLEADARTRTYLSALWQFLSQRLTAGDDAQAGPGVLAAASAGEDEGPLSYRQLGQRLHIPRERFPLLFTTLRQLLARCWAASRARLDARPRRRAGAGAAPSSS